MLRYIIEGSTNLELESYIATHNRNSELFDR